MKASLGYSLLFAALSLTLTACGGGSGGGDEFIGAARVSIGSSPSKIDSGDRTRVTTEVSDVHETGIILKFRFPVALVYVIDSAYIDVGGQEISIDVDVDATGDDGAYLVFFLPNGIFGEDEQGDIVFELEGVAGVREGKIAVDPDVDDPLIDNDGEFDVEGPEFEAADETDIEVIGQAIG